jgi:DNA mismatch repair protein MutL
MTSSIVRLDDVTASRIAAGEVVERPASVVKELIENSLDAGATNVRVEIRTGGRRLIQVVDDGCGIPADQVELAFESHATSKIRSADDLVGVRTLGFRGEALASIGAVSMVTMVSRAEGTETGTELRIDNGCLVAHRPIGSAQGTVVTVENLFQAVPARLAFLRREATEAGRVQEVVSRYALACPDRRFTFVRDGRTALSSPGSGALEDALVAVFGVEVAREMLPIAHGAPEEAFAEHRSPAVSSGDAAAAYSGSPAGSVTVTGYVSPPHVHRATRKHIALFVNGRWVQDRQLSFAVVQAYHTLLPKSRFPIAVRWAGRPSPEPRDGRRAARPGSSRAMPNRAGPRRPRRRSCRPLPEACRRCVCSVRSLARSSLPKDRMGCTSSINTPRTSA